MNRAADLAIGGWELTAIYTFTSGDPLTFDVPGGTLGNGWDTRPNLVGNLGVSNPSAALWSIRPRSPPQPVTLTATLEWVSWMDRPFTTSTSGC